MYACVGVCSGEGKRVGVCESVCGGSEDYGLRAC